MWAFLKKKYCLLDWLESLAYRLYSSFLTTLANSKVLHCLFDFFWSDEISLIDKGQKWNKHFDWCFLFRVHMKFKVNMLSQKSLKIYQQGFLKTWWKIYNSGNRVLNCPISNRGEDLSDLSVSLLLCTPTVMKSFFCKALYLYTKPWVVTHIFC